MEQFVRVNQLVRAVLEQKNAGIATSQFPIYKHHDSSPLFATELFGRHHLPHESEKEKER